MPQLSDVQIAQAANIRHIDEIAAKLGLKPEQLEHYGKYKAKINPADAYRLPEKCCVAPIQPWQACFRPSGAVATKK